MMLEGVVLILDLEHFGASSSHRPCKAAIIRGCSISCVSGTPLLVGLSG
jgi:hypothetical protein